MKIEINGTLMNKQIDLTISSPTNLDDDEAKQAGRSIALVVSSMYQTMVDEAPTVLEKVMKALPTFTKLVEKFKTAV